MNESHSRPFLTSVETTDHQTQLSPDLRLAQLEALFHSAPVGLCFISLDYLFVEANGHLARFLEMSPDQLLGKSVGEVLPGAAMQLITLLEKILVSNEVVQTTVNLQVGNRERTVVSSAERLTDPSGEVLGFSVAFLETQSPQQAAEALRDGEEHLRIAVVLTKQVLWTANDSGNVIDADEAWAQLTGLNRSEALGNGWAKVIHPDDQPSALERWKVASRGQEHYEDIYRVACLDQGWRWMQSRAIPRFDVKGEVHIWFGTLEDIHDRKQMEEALSMKTDWLEDAAQQFATLAQEDHLTGLANRRRLDSVLKDELKRAGRSGKGTALIMLDVDRFKEFNDTHGHLAGDECLRTVAGALREVLHRPGDLVARYGGEEFVILLPNTDELGAIEVAKKAIEGVRALNIKHRASPSEIVTISAGVAVIDAALIDASGESLLERADAALYKAKSLGRDRVISSSSLA